MHVALIGRYAVPYPYSSYRLDYPMLKVWAGYMTQLDLIVQSQDGAARLWQEGNFRVHYAPGGHSILRNERFVLWTMRRLLWLHKREPVHIVNGSDLFGSLAGLLLKPWMHGKVIAQLQGEFLPPSPFLYTPLRRKMIYALTRYICRHADAVRCLYAAAAEYMRSLGVPACRIFTIPSRCDTTLFDPNRFPPRLKGGTRLLYVGNLVPRKGLRFLLLAMPEVVRCFPSARLTIVGSGPQQAALEAMVYSLQLAGHVEFVGRSPHDQVPSLMHESNVFVFPSLSEATPRALMEAMAMALPVVATRVGGIPEMIEDGITGRLVPAGVVRELSDAIMWIFRHPEWVEMAGERAQQRVVTRYTLERHVEQMMALHQQVFSAGKG